MPKVIHPMTRVLQFLQLPQFLHFSHCSWTQSKMCNKCAYLPQLQEPCHFSTLQIYQWPKSFSLWPGSRNSCNCCNSCTFHTVPALSLENVQEMRIIITPCHLWNGSGVDFVTARHFRNSWYECIITPCLSCIVTPGHLGNGSCVLFIKASYLGNKHLWVHCYWQTIRHC